MLHSQENTCNKNKEDNIRTENRVIMRFIYTL